VSLVEYNVAFFGLYTNLFKVIKEEFNEEKALQVFTKIMVKGLKTAYDSMKFTKGKPEDFVRLLKARDESVGLLVKFPLISKNKVIYQFHTDPFPNLKGLVEPEKLDATYMQFKVDYLLGVDWKYKTTKHIWKGDPYTEHEIEKNIFN